MTEVTRILDQIDHGDPSVAELLLPLVYDELRKLAANRLSQEPAGQTLQPTALVHEAYLRLVQDGKRQSWESKGHFFAAAAEAMRRILIEKARKKKSEKAGGNRKRVDFLANHEPTVSATSGISMLALDRALKKLETIEPRKASLVTLRFFAGLTLKEAAQSLGISTSTADSDWAYAKAWLKVEMADNDIDFA